MDSIMELARKHGLKVIEDVAEAQGGRYKNRILGSFGYINCFSFLSNKIMTTGEGGMCVTDSAEAANRLTSLRGLAFGNTPQTRYLHTDLGFNYRLTNMQAAIGCAQLKRIDEIITKKREVGAWYNSGLKSVKDITLPVEMSWAKNVYWQYGIVVGKEFGISRDKMISLLKDSGIDARAFFVPMHQQPVFHKLGLFKNMRLPVSEWLGKNGLYLPSSTNLSKADVIRVCNVIRRLHK